MRKVGNVVRPHHGCHRQEWFLSSPQRGCSFSLLTRTGWTLPGRRSSASSQHGTTVPWARSHRDPAGAEPDTSHLGAREREMDGQRGGWRMMRGGCRKEGKDENTERYFKRKLRLWTVDIWDWMHHHPKHYLCMWPVTLAYHWLISWATTPHQHRRACSWPEKRISPGRSDRSAHCPPALPGEETHGHFRS